MDFGDRVILFLSKLLDLFRCSHHYVVITKDLVYKTNVTANELNLQVPLYNRYTMQCEKCGKLKIFEG